MGASELRVVVRATQMSVGSPAGRVVTLMVSLSPIHRPVMALHMQPGVHGPPRPCPARPSRWPAVPVPVPPVSERSDLRWPIRFSDTEDAECAHHAQHWTCWTASQRHIDQGARSEAADLGASTWANRGVARVHFKQSCTGDAGLPVYPALAGRAHDHVLEIAVVFQVQCRPRQSAPGAAPGSAVAECSGPRAHAG